MLPEPIIDVITVQREVGGELEAQSAVWIELSLVSPRHHAIWNASAPITTASPGI